MNKLLKVTTTAAFTLVLLSACVEESSVAPDGAALRTASADDLFVVDCLLPGQIRQLGSRMTYVTARRPIQTTVHDCQIRGGEYVAYDRATYQSALKIWMPLAEQGDADAQNKVGEIYERGIGSSPPDHLLAGAWYRKAADQGHKRAQISLGFLYEKGLGVNRDPESALSWYRKASELPDAVMIDRQALEAQQAQIRSLKTELDSSREELEKARRELRNSQNRLQQETEALRKRLQRTPTASLSDAQRSQLERDRRKLEQQRIELAQRQQRIRELEQQSSRQQQSLLLFETEGASQQEQLQLVRTQLERAQQDLQHYQQLASTNEQQLARSQADLAALSQNAEEAAVQRIQQLAAQLNEREQALGQQEHRVTTLAGKVAELSEQLEQQRTSSDRDLGAARQALALSRDDLQAARAAAEEKARALQQVQREMEEQQSKQGLSGAQLAALQVQLQEREGLLVEHKEMVQRLRKESDQLQQKLQQLEKSQGGVSRQVAGDDATAPPSIQLIDPPLMAVRGVAGNRIPIKRGLKKRTVVGQVTAPAGLFAVNVNGVRTNANDKGLFETEISLGKDETPVNVVAIDKQGKRTTLTFSLVSERDGETLVAKRINPLEGVDIGGYHALVIGNQDYTGLPKLDTAVGDAEAVARVLKDKFGYKVTLLRDANRYETLSALNRLRQELTDKDNLLVYYAGHGELDRVNLRGHWLPVDAEAHNTANWISNVAITDILNAMSVRHVLLIADSCYSGTLTRSALSQIESGQSEEARRHWLKTLTKMRSRTAMTSGGLAPVLDGGGGGHSVFANAFLNVLNDIEDITEGQRVYREVSARVAYEATRYQVEQVPEYAPIKFAGHESGDFLFIPKTYLN